MDINSYNEIWINILKIIDRWNIGVKSALFQLFCPTHVFKAVYKTYLSTYLKAYSNAYDFNRVSVMSVTLPWLASG